MRNPFVSSALLVALFFSHSASAEVKLFRGGTTAQLSESGGVWDFNTTAKWVSESDVNSLVPWDSNTDIAIIENFSGSGHVAITVDDVNGAVGASGIVITNNLVVWCENRFYGAPLWIGADGLSVFSDAADTFAAFYCPVVLSSTSPSLWRNAKIRVINDSGTVSFHESISSAPGLTTPLILDGFSIIDPSLKSMAALRTTFDFRKNNTYKGSTTIQNGGVLYLLFSLAEPGSKIDANSPLILSGGGLALTGPSTSMTQTVSSVVVKAGENFIGGKNGNFTFECGNIVREGLGGTMCFPVSWAGGITCYANNTNVDGLLGGWALLNDGAFAAMSGRSVGQQSGSPRVATDDWGNNQHIQVTGGGVRTLGDVSPYSVRYQNVVGDALTNDLNGAVLTIKSGGLANAKNGSTLQGGVLRSGFETGELFVFTSATVPFEISSTIEDNPVNGIPLTFVKAQNGKLVLSGALNHTGDTYLNGGTLSLTGAGASLSTPIHQSGGTWLELADGASLACSGRVLNGNLRLGPNAKLAVELGTPNMPLTLANRTATLNVTADMVNPVHLDFMPQAGYVWVKGSIPFMAFEAGVTLQSVNPDDFVLGLPGYVKGHVDVNARGLALVIDRVDNGSLFLVQ